MGSRLHSTDEQRVIERADNEFDVVCTVEIMPEFSDGATQIWIWDGRSEREISEKLSDITSEVYEQRKA